MQKAGGYKEMSSIMTNSALLYEPKCGGMGVGSQLMRLAVLGVVGTRGVSRVGLSCFYNTFCSEAQE